MSLIHLSLRDAARVVAVLALAASAAGCEKDNPNFCAGDDPRPECNVDARPIDAREGCTANPELCAADEDCLDNVCVDCTGADDHQDADCTDPAAPVCDVSRDCRACAADSECDSDFCDQGACAPENSVLFVEVTSGSDSGDNTCASKASPCRTLTHALSKVPPTNGAPAQNRRYIKLLTTGTYAEPGMVIIDDKTVVIVGAPPTGGNRSVIDRSTMGQTMEIKGQAHVRLERLAVNDANGNAAKGIECKESATLLADGIEVANNSGIGIVGDPCTLILRDSVVTRSAGGGVSVTNGRVVLVNNVIVDNGGNTSSSFGGLRLDVGVDPTSVVQSNTVAGNNAMATDGITCLNDTITVLNSIVFGDGLKARIAGTCIFDHTLYGPDDPGALLGTARGNMLVPNMAAFMFRGPADYHLDPGSIAKGKGTVTGLAPEAAKDLDGQPRPQGAPDVGADEIPD